MWQSNKKWDSNSHREKGAILFMVAGALIVLLGMAGLALDLGMLYNVRTDLQNAMDAASLAGAWKLDGTDAGITAAVASAQAAANKYHFDNTAVTLNPASEITFSPIRDSGYLTEAQVLASPGTSATIRFVRTTNLRTMDLAMIKVIPGVGSTQAVSAAAVAGQSPPVTTICDGVIPWLLPLSLGAVRWKCTLQATTTRIVWLPTMTLAKWARETISFSISATCWKTRESIVIMELQRFGICFRVPSRAAFR
jgi:Flp pilus assembly protein TadG